MSDAASFIDDLDCVVADPLRFKRKLRIGEDAYALLRARRGLQEIWDVGGFASTAATLAASKAVAGTFFAASPAWLSAIGIGAAATTPVGWVIAAAVATGGAYYGVTRLVRGKTGALVDTIPRFISTPIDLLGMQLLDLIGALALRMAAIDGRIAESERAAIERHFVEEWGYAPAYVAGALDVITVRADDIRIKEVARALSEFQVANPDCNAEAMQAELLTFLREVIEADGVLDEREDLAIDAITAVFRKERAVSLKKVGRSISVAGERTGSAVGKLARTMRPKPTT